MAASVTESDEDATAKVAEGVVLDHRRAVVHAEAGWMAVADLHFGYERHRRRGGALLPDWGMATCERALLSLLEDHLPRCLILAGDIMDGAGSALETQAFLGRLANRVESLICLRGNHDRTELRHGMALKSWHREGDFLFHHGDRFAAVRAEVAGADAGITHVVGHAHPAVRWADGAGLRLKLPAMVRERLDGGDERWVLPAFSPWAAGGEYRSDAEEISTWVCAPGRVFRYR